MFSHTLVYHTSIHSCIVSLSDRIRVCEHVRFYMYVRVFVGECGIVCSSASVCFLCVTMYRVCVCLWLHSQNMFFECKTKMHF